MDISDKTIEYSRVKVIVTTGDAEVIFDIPMVENFVLETNYEEPDNIQPLDKKPPRKLDLEGIAFTMLPKSDNDNIYMTITRTAVAKVVSVDEVETDIFHKAFVQAKSEWDNEEL